MEGTWALVGVEVHGEQTSPEAFSTPMPGCPRSRTTLTFEGERLTVSHEALCEGAGGWWTCGAHLQMAVSWNDGVVTIPTGGQGWGRLMPLEVRPSELDELAPPDTKCTVEVGAADFIQGERGDELLLRDRKTDAVLVLTPAPTRPDLDAWRRSLMEEGTP